MQITKPNLFLHVGVHKTGTTAIQTFLKENAENFKNNSYYIPESFFDYENKSTKLRINIFNNQNEAAQTLGKINNECINNCCSNVILSDEDFVNPEVLFNKKVDILKDYFEVKIIIYIRRQDIYNESSYAFSATYYPIRLKIKDIKNIKYTPNYYEILEFFSEIFGSENMIIKSYDEVKGNGNLLEDFLDTFYVENKSDFDFEIKGSKNITPNKYITEFLRDTNRTPLKKKEFEKVKEYLLTESAIQKGPKPIFYNIEDRKKLLELFGESNRLVANKYFNRENLFDDNIEIDLPEGISDEVFERLLIEIKKELNIELIENSKITNDNLAVEIFLKNIENSSNLEIADIYREIAIFNENIGDIKMALNFMRKARKYRPDGPNIIKKCKEYREILAKK